MTTIDKSGNPTAPATPAERPGPVPEKLRERRGHAFYPQVDLPRLGRSGNAATRTEDKVIVAHYFGGSMDWWLTEYDPKTGEAFGYADLGDPMNAEWGYTWLPELEEVEAHGGLLVIERDCWWEPKTFGEVMAARRG